MKIYLGPGQARLACSKAAKEQGHAADVHFVWQDGSEHVEHHVAELTCLCGRQLVHVAGIDPWSYPFVEVGGRPHGA